MYIYNIFIYILYNDHDDDHHIPVWGGIGWLSLIIITVMIAPIITIMIMVMVMMVMMMVIMIIILVLRFIILLNSDHHYASLQDDQHHCKSVMLVLAELILSPSISSAMVLSGLPRLQNGKFSKKTFDWQWQCLQIKWKWHGESEILDTSADASITYSSFYKQQLNNLQQFFFVLKHTAACSKQK